MGFSVRFTPQARDDLARLYDWLLQRAEGDFTVAERALQAIRDGVTVLEVAPLSCRKARSNNPFLREIVIGHVSSGYVQLFELQDKQIVIVLAVRQQHEYDYY
ncbi:type II toxin-antitoxin system RelE/ParE family toxin [Xanthomonas campestris pv. campestris]|uniref:type II toxin-antitoxin system RelE/ParE family toxin n=1 Tax=Xanthomonas campestris TaxID=339 RepID=UPI002AD3F4E9|nr:type II toxin-antitoxin system RelE/ParE family toxin [Xanthomonas campestris]MEA0738324.1 type II toxin-antitoxin system RelE/ParE family toxin [Xanthomonas campestris pv. campestris]